MAIKEVQLPLDNLTKKLRAELKSTETSYNLADGGDSNFHYLAGQMDGLRLAIYLISKEEQRLSKEA
jgi:hypothetical protein